MYGAKSTWVAENSTGVGFTKHLPWIYPAYYNLLQWLVEAAILPSSTLTTKESRMHRQPIDWCWWLWKRRRTSDGQPIDWCWRLCKRRILAPMSSLFYWYMHGTNTTPVCILGWCWREAKLYTWRFYRWSLFECCHSATIVCCKPNRSPP